MAYKSKYRNCQGSFFGNVLSNVKFFILEFVRTTEIYLNKNTLFYRTVYLSLWQVVILSLKLMGKGSEEGSILGVLLKVRFSSFGKKFVFHIDIFQIFRQFCIQFHLASYGHKYIPVSQTLCSIKSGKYVLNPNCSTFRVTCQYPPTHH